MSALWGFNVLSWGLLADERRVCVADKDATNYFRGIVKTGEKSQRVLELTEAIIRLNPAHYSAWCVCFFSGMG